MVNEIVKGTELFVAALPGGLVTERVPEAETEIVFLTVTVTVVAAVLPSFREVPAPEAPVFRSGLEAGTVTVF